MSSMAMARLATASSNIRVSAVPASMARVTNSVFLLRVIHSRSFTANHPQPGFALFGKLGIEPFEPRLRAGLGMLRDANPAGADALDRRIELLVLRETFGIAPA